MNNYKIGILKDKRDLVVYMTEDNIINITGMMGSGKSTLGRKIKEENNIELISLDWIFGYGRNNMPQKINLITKNLEKIYPETKNQIIFRYFNNKKKDKAIEIKYYEYTEKFYQYLCENVSKPIIIEGRHIYEYINKEKIKGKIIIKRTSLLHSYKRAFKRDVFRRWEQYKKREIKIWGVMDRFCQRVKIPITDYIKINRYIKQIMTIEKKEKNYDK